VQDWGAWRWCRIY